MHLRPEIVCSLGGISYDHAVSFFDRYASFELRIDLLDWKIEEINSFLALSPFTILTCRESTTRDRAAIFESVDFSAVDYLDLDIRSVPSFLEEWTDKASAKKVKILYSYHSYTSFSDPFRVLEEWGAFLPRADRFKIATQCETLEQLQILARFQSTHTDTIVMPMGEELAKYGRKWLAHLGNPWTYAVPFDHSVSATARGQCTCEELELFLRARESDQVLFAVAGRPISHSKSPDLFAEAVRHSDKLKAYLRLALFELTELSSLDFMPLSVVQVTSPFKEAAVEPFGQKRVRFSNCIRMDKLQKEYDNTDPEGVRNALDQIEGSKDVSSALVVGAGGAAWAACMALAQGGKNTDVDITARNKDQVGLLLREFPEFQPRPWFEKDEHIESYELIIWTVPARVMKVLRLQISPGTILLDANYKDGLADHIDIKDFVYQDGRNWLVGQAMPLLSQFEDEPIGERLQSIFEQDLSPSPRLALVGLPASGKSTLGILIAKRLGFEFCDLDQEIEDREGRTIAKIFSEEGEEYFRTLEQRHLHESAQKSRLVLATGGGTPIKKVGREILRDQFYVVWLMSRPEACCERLSGNDRPLIKGSDPMLQMISLYTKRWKNYAEIADLAIFVDGHSPDELALRIHEEYRRILPAQG